MFLTKNHIKNSENILVYDISYKLFMGKKPLRIRFDKIDGFIKIYGAIRYLVLSEHNEIYDKIKYLKVVLHIILIVEKILTFHNIITLIKSVANEQKINYYNTFLEKGSYKDKSNTEYF